MPPPLQRMPPRLMSPLRATRSSANGCTPQLVSKASTTSPRCIADIFQTRILHTTLFSATSRPTSSPKPHNCPPSPRPRSASSKMRSLRLKPNQTAHPQPAAVYSPRRPRPGAHIPASASLFPSARSSPSSCSTKRMAASGQSAQAATSSLP